MSSSAVGSLDIENTTRLCPHDKILLEEIHQGEAQIDRCKSCQGTFFDTGEMFAALGTHADPSYWDREETLKSLAEGKLKCPRCKNLLLVQLLGYDGEEVEIDRCGSCGGVWLDAGEEAKIMALGAKMVAVIDAEKAKAKAELDRMGDPDFSPPGLIYRFLSLFKKK